MEPEINPAPLTGPTLELAQLQAALAAGVPAEHAARLRGATADELAADAAEFVAAFVTAAPAPPAPRAPRAGGDRGPDVQGSGTLTHGAERYRQRAGLDEKGNRPPVAPRVNTGRVTNPYVENSYRTEHRS
ncbi:hypothetical protein [Streptomyces brevispora]|uniref:hypothetical protein n=1 Tax=Streptomyces brevispora TaxID=887462 RepID=UPI0038086E82